MLLAVLQEKMKYIAQMTDQHRTEQERSFHLVSVLDVKLCNVIFLLVDQLWCLVFDPVVKFPHLDFNLNVHLGYLCLCHLWHTRQCLGNVCLYSCFA